ncbi:maleylacetoacetate isomerase [Defluviimonas salinarum]|uniref:Maleylacetoacetate isomerase n=1 Tax=Defluviimonas salinarum TaxID=2992147 RepID=A0ABT3J5X9_9RHOB|nr:maleylacetoacetate isomerase [Defluviimonas salinarum]MCW3783097.1 maleylacetoacetate isomerase [Defluviimonas salinarum]
MRLYSYWRSTAAYRVRIALNLKGVPYDSVPVDLVAGGGAQHAPDYVTLNPAHLVPTLVMDDGTALTQSLAIIDWLDATHPPPPLLPADHNLRARILAAAHLVAMDIHPVNNLRVMQELERRFGAGAEEKADWMRHWMRIGFDALERMVAPDTPFAFTDAPTLADICLVAQIYNARRWGLDLGPYPRLAAIDAAARALPAFAKAAPEAQPDAPQS